MTKLSFLFNDQTTTRLKVQKYEIKILRYKNYAVQNLFN